MGINSREQWWIGCDQEGCYNSTDEDVGKIPESEIDCIKDAKRCGFVCVKGRWLCEEHAPKAER